MAQTARNDAMTLFQLANRNRDDWPLGKATMTVRDAAKCRPVARLLTRLPWLDAILGGGFARGSVVLVHGEPGAGKSTCLAQAVAGVRGSLYVTAEEELGAVAGRFLRLGLRDDVNLLRESNMDTALATAGAAPLLIIDSVQMMAPGLVPATQAAIDHARARNVCVVLVCHEVKSGQHAGPRVIEHMIDCTVAVRRGPPRGIMVAKNRYGPAGIGIALDMTERGLVLKP